MKSIKTIVFDLGGVLIDLNVEKASEKFWQFGYPRDEMPVDPYKQSGPFLKLEEGLIEPQEYYDFVNSKLPRPVSAETINSALYDFVLGIPDYKLTMLSELRGQGYQIFMLSNTNVIMFEYMRDNKFTAQGLTVDDYFDKLYLSYRMKCAKPHDVIFEKMIADSGILPSQTLFIDDAKANIETAAKLGFETYLAGEKEDYRHIFNHIALHRD